MRRRQASHTAAYVAWLRALGDHGITSAEGFRDAEARRLLPSPWGRAVCIVAPAIARLPSRARARVIRHVDLLVRRSLAVDAELERATLAGCKQVVILGAGFDDRAHRMTELADASVLEVDHPATQSVKKENAASLPQRCRTLTYVACDFERDALGDVLARAGHRLDEPTAWIWEGVTLYLTDEAIRETLATIAKRSAPKSRLIVEYHELGERKMTAYTVARKYLLAFWAEPQIGRRPTDAMHADLHRAGLHVEKDFPIVARGSARLAVACAPS